VKRSLRLQKLASRWYWVIGVIAPALAIAAVVSMTASAAPANVREQIDRAVRAPYEALAHQDATAFCGAFTLAATAKIVAAAPPTSTCTEAVGELFERTVDRQEASVALPSDWNVTSIVWHGNYASASVRYGQQPVASLVLRKIAHRWLVATKMRLVPIVGCNVQSDHPTGCPEGTPIVIALAELPTGSGGPMLPTVPAVVRRAGGKELSDFKQGRLVFAQSGCEACHRMGVQGNPGPGPDLTHVGSLLSTREIEHALLDPTQPMPSFKGLPPAKFHALVRFLSLLH